MVALAAPPVRPGQGSRARRPCSATDAIAHAAAADPRAGSRPRVSRQLAFDTLQRLLPSLLRYEDRNSMAFSIETRLPFLDYRLVEFVFSLPDEQKLDGATHEGDPAPRARRPHPARACSRARDKMGFETPTDVWLRGRYADEVRRRLLTTGPLHDWLDVGELRDELEDYLEGTPRDRTSGVALALARVVDARAIVAADPRAVASAAGASHPATPTRQRHQCSRRPGDRSRLQRRADGAGATP